MNLLLDTHVMVWALSETRRLSEEGRALIADADNIVFVSVVSLWELAIKAHTGRTGMPEMEGRDALELSLHSGYRILDITPAHALRVAALPLRHRDPFDRMLVAQALSEPLRLLTRDAQVAAYSDTVILV